VEAPVQNGVERDRGDRLDVVVGVEEQQLDRGCILGVDGEVDAAVIDGRAERLRPSPLESR
jgi:hypothetical protein